MMQNDSTTNTEGGNVGNKPRSDAIGDVVVPKEKFLFKEPIVLMSIVCLTVFNGLALLVQPRNYGEIPLLVLSWSSLVVPMVGSVFAAFLSEVNGRKPVYRYLFALSVFLGILLVTSKHETTAFLTFLIHNMIRGGCSVMNAVAISEYSSPKHRFAWMILNVGATNTIGRVMRIVNFNGNFVFYVLLVIQIVLGLICFGSTWVWPESPYWLASKGKLDQSRMAFMWLRGEGGREELASVLKARRRPGPTKLFWTSLAIALATISVSIFSGLQVIRLSMLYYDLMRETPERQFYINLFSTVAIFSVIAAVSYLIKRKLLFIIVCVISFILSYAEALWLYLAPRSEPDSVLFILLYNASDVMRTCGPAVFGVILFIEIAPYKYNTIISCICFTVMFVSIAFLVALSMYLEHAIGLNPSVLLALFTTLSLVAALLYYFFAQETKDKTLLEIHRSYTPDENASNTEQNQSMMLNVM